MGYWKSKVLPKIKRVFDKNGTKKAAAAEACKSFDDSKEAYNKELDENKTVLQPKVVEIYEASSSEIKTLVKEPKDAELKKQSVGVQTFLEELVKIEFPGSKAASEASSKYGPPLVSGPVLFVLEKVSTFVVTEVETPPGAAATATGEETSGTEKEKELVVEAEKKEELSGEAETAEPPAAAAEEAAAKPPKP